MFFRCTLSSVIAFVLSYVLYALVCIICSAKKDYLLFFRIRHGDCRSYTVQHCLNFFPGTYLHPNLVGDAAIFCVKSGGLPLKNTRRRAMLRLTPLVKFPAGHFSDISSRLDQTRSSKMSEGVYHSCITERYSLDTFCHPEASDYDSICATSRLSVKIR